MLLLSPMDHGLILVCLGVLLPDFKKGDGKGIIVSWLMLMFPLVHKNAKILSICIEGYYIPSMICQLRVNIQPGRRQDACARASHHQDNPS